MASNADGSVTLDFSIDTDGLSKEIDNMNKSVEKFAKDTQKNMDSVDDAAKDFLDTVDIDGIDKAEKDLSILTQRIKDLGEMRTDTAKGFEEASRTFGKDSKQADALREALDKLDASISINTKKADDLAAAVNKARDAKKKATQTTKEYGSAASDAAGKTDKLSSSQGKAEKNVGSFQVALGNLVARGIEKAVSAIGDLLSKTKELEKQMSMLELNAERAGVSTETIEESMKRLNLVTEDTDSQLEALSNLLLAGVEENNLMEAVDALGGAVVAVPGTMQIENIAESLQETVATGEAVGQFAELLDRYGVDVDEFTERLGQTSSESERLNMALEELTKTGLAEYYQTYRDKNPDLVDAADAQVDFNNALSKLSEVLRPLETEVMKDFARILSDNKETIEALGEVLSFLLDGILQIFDAVAQMPPELTTFLIILGGVVTIASKMDNALGDAEDAVEGVVGGIKTFTKALDGSYNSVAQWVVLIAVLVATLSLLLYLILAVKDGTEKAGQAMNNFKMPEVPQLDQLSPNSVNSVARRVAYSNISAHAGGTESAWRGWSWVGERGPELMYLGGGEKILTATQSMAMNMLAGRGAGHSYNQTINISVNGIGQLDAIVKWFTTRRQMERAK